MTIALGVTWSETLASDAELMASLDFVEIPAWLIGELETPPHPCLVLHNLDLDWSLASRDAIDSRWEARLRAALDWTRSPWFSLHLGFAAERVRFDYHMLPVSEPLPRDLLLERMVANLTAARTKCPVPLAIENLDYCPEGAYEHVCEPAFISEVLNATGYELLLDIGHLQVTASWLGTTAQAMLDTLPLERVREIHLSSPRAIEPGDARLDDAHEVLTALDYELLETVLRHASPSAITLEYRRSLPALRELVLALRTRFVN